MDETGWLKQIAAADIRVNCVAEARLSRSPDAIVLLAKNHYTTENITVDGGLMMRIA